MSPPGPTAARPRVFDCFTFNDEVELLQFRLDLLSEVVDHFVLVEATRTFAGGPKPLVYRDLVPRLGSLADKVIPVAIEDLPDPAPDRWVAERFQRNAIMRGLGRAAPDDIVLVSDLDEIPAPEVIDRLTTLSFHTVGLEMRACYYRGNWEAARPWMRAKATHMRDLRSPENLRLSDEETVIPMAGAHLSYLMGPGRVSDKYGAFAHAELDTPRARSLTHIRSMIALAIFAPEQEALRITQEQGLDAVQGALLRRSPELFEFDAPARTIRWLGVRWARFRNRRRLPAWLVSLGDEALAVVLRLLRVRPSDGPR